MSSYAPFRYVVLWTLALMLVSGMVSSSARAVTGIVTARVSLERGAAGQRLMFTTTQPVAEPALRLAANARLAREPGQERPAAIAPLTHALGKKTAAARREPPESSGTGVARIAQRPVGVDMQIAPAVLRYASTDAIPSGGSLRPVAAIGDAVRIPLARTEPEIDRSKDMWWTIAVAVVGFAVIVLGAIVVRQGRGAPKASPSDGATRGTARSGPRSSTNLSAAPVMLSHANIPSEALLTRAAPTTRSWVSPATAVTLPNLSTASKPGTSSTDREPVEESLDTLFNEIDSDLNVETAIRKVHAAAAHGSPEYDIGCEAILKAIEAAERDLMLAPPAPTDAAMGRALEDELLVKPKRKAA